MWKNVRMWNRRQAATTATFLLALATLLPAQRLVIPVWPGAAPGSEDWTQKEVDFLSPQKEKMVRNIVRPTLTAYLPDKSKATGTAVIVCPGGGFRLLSWQSEGTDVAEWLQSRGVAAFVLKYRVIDTGATEQEFRKAMAEFFEKISRGGTSAVDTGIRDLAAADGREAVKIVRKRASEWGISPDRIGIMGFSAGGMVTMSVALKHDADSRPDFAAPIYGTSPPGATVPADAGPAFILCAGDDPLIPPSASQQIYSMWKEAGRTAELHVYAKGGHGFGMKRQNLPVDHWIDRFGDWLVEQRLVPHSAMQDRMQTDWPNLSRYRLANAKLSPPQPGENRVVFYGDSITDAWVTTVPEFFRGKPYLDRGISGQTTPQMLVRFRQDVVDLKPKVVVILAGTNDIAGNTGPSTPEMIQDNFRSMVEIARAHGIRPVLASVLPAADYPWKPGLEPGPKIAAFNRWLQQYAQESGIVYLDYYAAMVNDKLGLPIELSGDGVHPNKAGYAIMGPLAEKAIDQALLRN